MIFKIRRKLKKAPPVHTDQLEPLKKGCRAFDLLNAWQLKKYRSAVTDNKWYMGERFNRHVSWTEAESDFLHNDFYGCAPKWRIEYCSSRCSHIKSCELGQQFCNDQNHVECAK